MVWYPGKNLAEWIGNAIGQELGDLGSTLTEILVVVAVAGAILFIAYKVISGWWYK